MRRYHCLVPRFSLGVMEEALAHDGVLTLHHSVERFQEALNCEPGSVAVVDPAHLGQGGPDLLLSVAGTQVALILTTFLTPSSASVLLHGLTLRADAIVLLPHDNNEHIRQSFLQPGARALQLRILSALAPRLAKLPDVVVPGVLLALHGHNLITSVKSLAAFCGTSTRSIERSFECINVAPTQLLSCARFLRARMACDWRWAPVDVARFSGYAQPQALWRAVRMQLDMEPVAFKGAGQGPFVALLLDTLADCTCMPRECD